MLYTWYLFLLWLLQIILGSSVVPKGIAKDNATGRTMLKAMLKTMLVLKARLQAMLKTMLRAVLKTMLKAMLKTMLKAMLKTMLQTMLLEPKILVHHFFKRSSKSLSYHRCPYIFHIFPYCSNAFSKCLVKTSPILIYC